VGVRVGPEKGGAVLGGGLLFMKTREKKSCEIFLFNQSLIDPDQIFNHDPDRDENF
jgi:hypothetical protein